jgi:hypothetical protein
MLLSFNITKQYMYIVTLFYLEIDGDMTPMNYKKEKFAIITE